MCAIKMKTETTRWARRYLTALRRYLAQGASASLQPALRLGQQASALGLETLALALIHEQALAALVASDGSVKTRERVVNRAKSFFAETLVPIEKTHGAAMKANVRTNQLTQALHRRTAESASSVRHLKRNIIKRQRAEEALKKSGSDRTKLLRQSHSLHTLLREQMRKIISTQEKERKKTSLQLQDEVAQTLLAINIGLLALKTSAKANTRKISKEITNTQHLVRESIKRVNGMGL